MSERQAGWVQGSGACKRSLDGKTNSPHYGGYTTHAVESGEPPHGVIVVVVVVVEYYLFLTIIKDVHAPGRRGHFYRTVVPVYHPRLFRSRSARRREVYAFMRRSKTSPTTDRSVVGVIRFLAQTRLSLVVSE